MDNDSLKAVADDLHYLREWGPETSDGELRRGTAILRRLLVEDVYGAAWRATGETKQPSLVAVDLSLVLGSEITNVLYAIAAGAHFRGLLMASLVMHKGSQPIGVHSPPIRPEGYPGERVFPLSDYLSSLSGVVEGRTFTRREVVKYIANVKGGVHLGAQQKKAEAKLVARLSKIERKITVHTTDGLLVEVAAIGQALASSTDSKKLLSAINAI